MSNRNETLIIAHIQAQQVQWPPADQYYLALSGGLDSVVLLHALCQLAIPFKAIHIHHGLQAKATDWAEFCQQLCQTWQRECQVIAVQVPRIKGQSLEAAARLARYQAFADIMQPGVLLLTAHHQDDQAETVLLQLLRGCGLRGLSAMPAYQAFGPGGLARPLLGISRKCLAHYAQTHHLSWVEDDSNAQIRFSRNFLRHEVIPVLKKRWPQLGITLARSAHHAAEAVVLLDELAQQDQARIKTPAGLSVSQLNALSSARRRNVLRYYIRQQGLPIPDQAHLKRIEQEVLTAAPDKNPQVIWLGAEARRYRDTLYLMPPLPAYDPAFHTEWILGGEALPIPGIGLLKATWQANYTPSPPTQAAIGSCWIGYLRGTLTHLTVRFRSGGNTVEDNRVAPAKKQWQRWGIPPWLRGRQPLLYQDKQWVMVIGYGIYAPFQARPQQAAWRIEWQSPSA